MRKYTYINLVIVFLLGCCSDPITVDPIADTPLNRIWEVAYIYNGWGADAPPTLINDSLLLFTGDDNITCVNIDSGQVRWSSTLEYAGSRLKRFVYDDTQLYGFTGDDNIYALGLSDGGSTWEAKIDSGKSFSFRASVDQEHYYVGTSSDYSDTYTVWKYSKEGTLMASVPAPYMPWQVANHENKLYVLFGWSPLHNPKSTGRIISYDGETLDSSWVYDEPGGSFSMCYPVFENGIMYVGTVWGEDNKTVALNVETGEVIWENKRYGCYRIILSGDTLFYDGGGGVHALNKHTGEEIWWTPLPNPDESTTLSYWDGYIYIENFGFLYILKATTGEIVHTMVGPDNSPVEQVSAGAGKIFVQSTQHLYAFSPYYPEKNTN